MTASAERERFVEYVRVQLRRDEFVSRDREMLILQDGLKHFQLDREEGQWVLVGVCRDMGASLESELDHRIDAVLQRFAETDDRIDRDEFEDAVAIYASWASSRLSEDEIAKKLKARIVDRDWRVGRDGVFRPRRWFNRI